MTTGEEHRWSTVRDKAIDLFAGELPGAQLENDIIEHFVDDPERVIRAIHRIATATGTIDSRWAVLRADLQRGAKADVIASATASRQKLIDRATTWIRNTGLYHNTWQECEAELFGDSGLTPPVEFLEQLEHDTRGNPGRHLYETMLLVAIDRTRKHGPDEVPADTSALLYSLRDDQQARDQLHAEWITQRPRGEQAERDHQAWCAAAAANRAVILERQRKERQCSPASPGPQASSSTSSPAPSSEPSATASGGPSATEPEPATAGNPFPW